MSPVHSGELSAAHLSVAIVAARFNDFIVASLLRGAVEAWERHGGAPDRLVIARVPGAFELPVAARQCAVSGRFAAVVALGCVIRGDTAHFDYVAGECARGLTTVALDTGVPVMFGVLTVETVEQAVERAAVRAGNKGGEAMCGAIEMANLLPRLA
ncbi:MAG: 6,7-dimethyl-8-ribityllumazine synthase [Steroidobacteraceae bacterium]|nr:6,7-dimethyl-8-ribityllumazine synthase [Steroidobacteraceae bacterium]